MFIANFFFIITHWEMCNRFGTTATTFLLVLNGVKQGWIYRRCYLMQTLIFYHEHFKCSLDVKCTLFKLNHFVLICIVLQCGIIELLLLSED